MPDKEIFGEQVTAEQFNAMKSRFDCATGGFKFSKEIYADLLGQEGADSLRTYIVVNAEGFLNLALTAVDVNNVDFGQIYEKSKGID